MFRRIWTFTLTLAAIIGIAAGTAGPASAGIAVNHCEPLARR